MGRGVGRNMADGKRKLLVLLLLLAVTLYVILLACRRSQARPSNVPSTAVLVNGDYIDCNSGTVERPCTVYDGSNGDVLGRDPMEERLRAQASAKSGSAIDCGRTSMGATAAGISECAQMAFRNGKPFFFRTDTGWSNYGLAGDAYGNVSWIVYDIRGLPPVVASRFSQLFDEYHTGVTSCIRPIKLEKGEEGLLGCVTPINEEASAAAARQRPMESTVCAVLENPAAFNNKLVRLHGHVFVNFEYSFLFGDGCSGAMWFDYSGNGGPPGLVMYVSGQGEPGAEDADGKRILPIPVKLVRDRNLEHFERLMQSRSGTAEHSRRANGFPFHQVRATFIGRVDGVSPEVHAYHLNPPEGRRRDFLGFGGMGGYDARFVMQSVENDAVLEKRGP